ncbi:MAG TPA: thiamine pyrophosphate-dependent enzyme, partial [Pseudonocardiaceae bacterium]
GGRRRPAGRPTTAAAGSPPPPPVWHTSLQNPDWAAYARLCGATGIRVERREQLDAAMRELFAADGPALLCVEQDPELL